MKLFNRIYYRKRFLAIDQGQTPMNLSVAWVQDWCWFFLYVYAYGLRWDVCWKRTNRH